MSNLVGLHRSRPGARSVGGQGSSYDISFVRWGYRNMMVRLLSETKKDLVWRVCIVKNAHIHFFREGTMSARSVQKPGGVCFLGQVFNQVQVFTLLRLIAQITGNKPGKAYHKIVNAHIYEDQLELMRDVQLAREPHALPQLHINPDIRTLEDLETWVTLDDFSVTGYEHHPAIKYPFSV